MIMARFRLTAAWAGPPYLEAGTEIDLDHPNWAWITGPMPLCAMALDDAAMAHLIHAYVTDPHDLTRILCAKNVKAPTGAELPMWKTRNPKPKEKRT